MYANGLGVPQDYREAVKWFRKSAQHGDTHSQFNLALLYRNGDGVPQDYVSAYAWWNTAVAQGDEGSQKNRDTIIKQMTPAQIEKAQELSKEYYKKYVLCQ